MTRFARAKGSKSSNEKRPEEATSWSEMKSSMLLKKSNKPNIPTFNVEVKKDVPVQAEWACLGDDIVDESLSLLKQHSAKNNRSSEKNKKEKKPKAEKNALSKLCKNKELRSKKKVKKPKTSALNGINSEVVIKKGKKRKFTEDDKVSELTLPKKKKLGKNEERNFNLKEKLEHKAKKTAKGEHKQLKKLNNTMVPKYFKMENEDKQNFNSRSEKQYKTGKKFKNNKSQEKHPAVEDLIINGEKIPIVKFQGFYITLEDAERLKKLRIEMVKEGIPKSQLESAIKLERRRAEKALSRLKKSVCFHCRNHGHLLSNCPNLNETENSGTGICYKCGSTEHSAIECKVVRGTNYQFAECFICKEQGHIARQCPDNPRGLYPQGGACRECGDVTHLRKDCPQVQAQKADEMLTVGLRSDRDLECLDEEIASREKQKLKKSPKKHSAVKF